MDFNKRVADLFYNQCCGFTVGISEFVPTNPSLYSTLLSLSHSNLPKGGYCMTKSEFTELLKFVITNLENSKSTEPL